MTDYQSMIDEAWRELDHNPEGAAALARVVLASHPDAIDAYVVLAAATYARAEAIALLREALRTATRMAGADRMRELERPDAYDREAHLRAVNNLARLLWDDLRPGSRKEALMHARQALRLDANDRAGTRYLLMAWEASAGNWPAARKITRSCRGEGRTETRYWLALHAFRDRAAAADALLDKAIATNPYVSAALERRVVPMRLPTGSYGFGSPDEAALYAADARDGWMSTPGALQWLSSHSLTRIG